MWGWLWDLLTFLGLFKKNAAIVLLVRHGGECFSLSSLEALSVVCYSFSSMSLPQSGAGQCRQDDVAVRSAAMRSSFDAPNICVLRRYKLKHGTIKSFIPTQRARFEEIVRRFLSLIFTASVPNSSRTLATSSLRPGTSVVRFFSISRFGAFSRQFAECRRSWRHDSFAAPLHYSYTPTHVTCLGHRP